MADEPVEPIQQKICVLKASIHCEGCKRKVKKLLLQLQGVDSVDVDTKLQKVTVTGDVEPHSLINKLAKSGKNAELWPQKIHGNGNTKKKEIDIIDNPSSINVKSPEQPPKTEVPVENRRGSSGGNKSDAQIGGGAGESSAEADSVPSVKITAGIQESKSQEKRSEENCSTVGEPAKSAEEKAVEKSNGGGESGTSGKKKKKRGQSDAKSGGAAPPPEQRESGNLEPPPPANHSPPRGHHYYAPPLPPQPVYGVSYNTTYPMSSYTTSYYAAPPPYSYAYMHPGPVVEPTPPSDPEVNPRQPLDSFEIFSDENPNGCFVM